MSSQIVCLAWDGHHSTLLSVFEKLLESSQLVDCSIASEGQKLKAHKEVLSAFSPYFEFLLREANESNPTIILSGIKFNDMKSVIDFMYHGKLEVSEDRIEDLIGVAECLQIKGLSGIDEENVLSVANNISSVCERHPLSSGIPRKQRKEVEEEPASISCKNAAVNHKNYSNRTFTQHDNAADVPTGCLASQICSVSNMVPNLDVQIPRDLSLSLIPAQPTQSPIEMDNLLHGESLVETNTYLDIVENVLEPLKYMDDEIIISESSGNSNETSSVETMVCLSSDISVTSDDHHENLPPDCVPLEVLSSQSCSKSLIVASERNELASINLPLPMNSTVSGIDIEDPLFHSEFHMKTEQNGDDDETLVTECADLRIEKDECSESMMQINAVSSASVGEIVEKNDEKCSSDCSDRVPGRTGDEFAKLPQPIDAMLKRIQKRPRSKQVAEIMPGLPAEAAEPQNSPSDPSSCLSQKKCRKDVPNHSGVNVKMQSNLMKKRCHCQLCKTLSSLRNSKLHTDGVHGCTEEESTNQPQQLTAVLKRTQKRPGSKQVAGTMLRLPTEAAESQVSTSNPSTHFSQRESFSRGKDESDPSEMNANVQSILAKKKLCCQLCGRTLSSLSTLKYHMQIHTGERPYQCDKCKFATVTSIRLKEHKRIHNKDKPYKCSDCDFKTVHRRGLETHQRIHSGLKPYKCTQCNYASANSSNLNVHKRIHSGLKPFKCSECDYKAVKNGDLQQHKFMHSGHKPYKCNKCKYACSFICNLKRHQQTYHGLKPSKRTKRK